MEPLRTDGRNAVVDTCVHHRWSDDAEVVEHLPQAWRDYLGTRHTAAHISLPPTPFLPAAHYPHPFGDSLQGEDGAADAATIGARHLEPNGIERAILCHDAALTVPGLPNTRLSLALIEAINDWTMERWLTGGDERLYGTILVSTQVPTHAAAEIRRCAEHDRMVAVVIGSNGLARPFGHEIYRPMLEAAADTRLPIVIHSGGDTLTDTLAYPTAGGTPASFSAYYALSHQSLATHLVNLIGQGTFERYRDLTVVFAGAGAAWVVPVIWRMTSEFKAFRREAPYLRRPISEYVRDHVRVTTNPIDRAEPASRLATFLDGAPELADVLCYGSGYPGWDTDHVADIVDRLPAEWLLNVLERNAAACFRWPSEERRKPEPLEVT